MEDIGKYIKTQREARGVSLEQLSKETLISTAVLKDIEEGKFDKYKGDESYVKMYLKKIANCLELDYQEIAKGYLELTQQMSVQKLQEEEMEQANKGENQNTTFIGKVNDLFQDIKDEAKQQTGKMATTNNRKKVYEDHYIRRYIKYGAVLLLCIAIVVVIWYALVVSKSTTDNDNFSNPKETQVEGVDPTKDKNEDKPKEDQSKPDEEDKDKETPQSNITFNPSTSRATYELKGIKAGEPVKIEVTFKAQGAFNLWLNATQVQNAYGIYNVDQVYTYETTMVVGNRYAFNFWNLSGAEIKINGTVLPYDANNVMKQEGASIIIVDMKGE